MHFTTICQAALKSLFIVLMYMGQLTKGRHGPEAGWVAE